MPTIGYATPANDDYISSATPQFGVGRAVKKKRGEPNPLGPVIHEWLPIGLIALGYGIPAIFSLIAAVRSPIPFLSLLLLFIFNLLIVFVVTRITVVGLQLASHWMDFELVASPGFRVMAAFATGPLVGLIFEQIAVFATAPMPGAPIQSPMGRMFAILTFLVFGLIIGQFVSFFALWLFFGLRFKEAVVAWLLAWIANFIGWALAMALFIGAILVIAKMKEGTDSLWGDTSSSATADSTPAPTRQFTPYIPPPTPPPQMTAPNPALTPNPVLALQQKRDTTRQHMLVIRALLQKYAAAHPDQYPTDLNNLAGLVGFDPALLHSPFNASSTGVDYVIDPNAHPTHFLDGRFLNCIIAYDSSEMANDTVVTAITYSGVHVYSSGMFPSELQQSQQVLIPQLNAINQQREQGINPNQPGQNPPIISQNTTPNPGDVQPNPPRNRIDDTPEDTGVAGWTATVDAPAKPLQFKEDFHWFTPKTFQANDLLYSANASTVVAAGLDFVNGSTGAGDVHEAWDLHGPNRIGRIVGPLPLKHAVLSPDGQYIAGMVTGGPDAATVFEMWSFKTGRKAQTFLAPPVQGSLDPMAIGFHGADGLITMGDSITLWDFKTGAAKIQITLNAPRESSDQYALSANGKLMAILNSHQRIDLYDLDAGKYLGFNHPELARNRMMMGIRTEQPRMAFSPDGSEIAQYVESVEDHVVVYSTAGGKQLADFKIPAQGRMNMMNGKGSILSWLPDGSGWLLDGSQIVDRQTGIILASVADQQINGAQEYGPRMVISDHTVIMSFKAFTNQVAIGTYPLPADVIAQARTAVHGGSAPATQPADNGAVPQQ